MGTVTKTIGSAGGRDYSTLQAWEDALPANFVTDGNSQIGQCYADSEFVVAGTVLTIAGETTDATHTLTLNCGAGQSFRDNANAQTNALFYNASNGVGLRNTAAYVAALVFTVDFVTIDGLQITSTANSNNGPAIDSNSSCPHTFLQNLICESAANTRSVMGRISNVTIRNCLVISRTSGANGIQLQSSAAAYNCTVVRPSDKATTGTGILGAYASPVAQNCAVFGFATAASGLVTSTTNMTDVASPPSGFTGSKTYANQFQVTTDATRDFRLLAGADLLDVGTTDSTNAANDIVGTTRPQGSAYDIGAWELVVAAGLPCGAIMM